MGFAVGGDSSVSADGAGACVIGGEGEDEPFEGVSGLVGVFVEVAGEEFDSSVEVLLGVVAVGDSEAAGGSGHELSEALGAGVASRVGVEGAFGEDEGHDEAGVYAVVCAVGEDCAGDVFSFVGGEASVLPLDPLGVGGEDGEEVGGELGCAGVGLELGEVAGHAGRPVVAAGGGGVGALVALVGGSLGGGLPSLFGLLGFT